mmetsp:Transcript_56389/g.123198  ORF Transcript_56389/g.123198 Transcript_56389/m.123198 type:complete len:345 (-) Transcript_56389:106-1140(-)
MASQVTLYACAGLMLLIACGGFALFGVAFAERNRLDPFWEVMVCTTNDVYVSDRTQKTPSYTPEQLGFDSSDATDMSNYALALQAMTISSFHGWTSKLCVNPNQVNVDTGTTVNGSVWVEYPDTTTGGYQLLPVGESWIPATNFPIGGSGAALTWNTFSINGSVAYWATLQPSVTVISTLHYKTTSTVTFFGSEISSVSEGISWCGYKANFLTSTMGPTTCEDTYEELVIPEIDAEGEPDKMEGTKKDIENSEKLRDLVCGLIMAVGLLIGLGCPSCAALMIWRSLRSKRAQRLTDSKSGDTLDGSNETDANRDLEDAATAKQAGTVPQPEKKMLEEGSERSAN